MPGVGDPDNRRMMRFDSLSNSESRTLAKFKMLIDIRKSHIEFIYGTTLVIDAGMNYMVIKRQYFDHVSYVLFNNSDKNIDIPISKNEISDIDDFKTYCMSEIEELTKNYQIKVQANSFEIISKY
jgi:glycosidase